MTMKMNGSLCNWVVHNLYKPSIVIMVLGIAREDQEVEGARERCCQRSGKTLKVITKNLATLRYNEVPSGGF